MFDEKTSHDNTGFSVILGIEKGALYLPTGTFLNEITCRGGTIPLDKGTLIMGVLNVTPDSFSDGGRFDDPVKAWDHAQKMIDHGATLLDIGGESTRPGATYVDEEEELRRVKPVLQLLGKQSSVKLSIDTRKAPVARMALELGATLINDVSALQDDPDMADLVRTSGAGVVLMHRREHSAVMQHDPRYHDVVEEVRMFLAERMAFAQSKGISPGQIILDPGIGFGKTVMHNLQLLANVEKIVNLGQPVLVGASRKKFLGELTKREVQEREFGHAAALALAVWKGVALVRVHDVEAAKGVVNVAQALSHARASTS